MKKIVLPLIAVTAIGAIAPKLVGSQLNTSLNDVVAHINNMPGYQATLSNVETTWFNTTADIAIKLEVPSYNPASDDQAAQESVNFAVNIDFDASHGPLLLGQHSGLGWVGWTATVQGEQWREHAQWVLESPIYQLTSTMGLFGSHNFSDQMPKVSINEGEQSLLSFSGYQGHGTYNGKALVYAGMSETVTASMPQFELKGENLSFEMDMQASIQQALEQGFYDSLSKLNLAKLVVNSGEDNQTTELKNAYISAATTIDDEKTLGSLAMSYGVDEIDVDSFHGEDIALDMEFNNISADVLKAWQKFAEQLTGVDPEQMQLKMQEFGKEHLLTLLVAEPQINITSLRATLVQGKVVSNIHASLVGIDALPMNLENIGFWASHALMNGKIEGDKAAIEFVASKMMKQQMMTDPQAQEMTEEELDQMAMQQTQGMLGMLAQQGMVTASETNYISVLKFEKRELTVNDKVIPLPIPEA